MTAATLPRHFRVTAHAAAGTVQTVAGDTQAQTLEARRRVRVVNQVCNRAARLSDSGKLTGRTADELAEQIYGNTFIWIGLLWQYRALIWQVIRLLAELAFRERRDAQGAAAFDELKLLR